MSYNNNNKGSDMLKHSEIECLTDTLTAFKKRSTCARVQVSALLVRDGRVISTGWNGVAARRQTLL